MLEIRKDPPKGFPFVGARVLDPPMFRGIKANERGPPSSPNIRSISVCNSLCRSKVEGYKIDSEGLNTGDVIIG